MRYHGNFSYRFFFLLVLNTFQLLINLLINTSSQINEVDAAFHMLFSSEINNPDLIQGKEK